MNILCTGFTQRAVNSQRLRYDYLTASLVLPAALRRLKHTVAHRDVVPGEDLSSFDLAIITVGPPKSLTARHLAGSAYAYLKAKRVILACDDWSIENARGNAESTLRCWDRFWPWYNDRGQWCDADAFRIKAMITDMLKPSSDNIMLAPMFPWGRHSLLTRATFPVSLVTWDPTPLVQPPYVSHPRRSTERARAWILGSLQGEPDLPRLEWPIVAFGNKRAKQEYIPEAKLLEEYTQAWGVLCPPYKTAGSGWWRARYHWSAYTKNVLWCHASDRAQMGPPYQYGSHDIELLSDEDLQAAANAQHDWFFDSTWKLGQTLDALKEAIS